MYANNERAGLVHGTSRDAGEDSFFSSVITAMYNRVVIAGAWGGKGCLLVQNITVTEDIPDNVLAGGVPAQIIKPRQDDSVEQQN
jgi:hypothetical protein